MMSFYNQIPHGWSRDRIRFLIDGCKNGAWGSEAGEDEENAICVRVADFDWDRFSVLLDDPTVRSFPIKTIRKLALKNGDLIIEKSGGGEKTPVGRIVSFEADQLAVTSNFVARIRPNGKVHNRFLLYLLAAQYMTGYSHQFIKQNTGIQNLDDAAWFSTDAWLPDSETQAAIVEFLDRETARIDKLIEKKQRLVELLTEKLETLRDTAVVKGLDPDASYTKSGVDWFGLVPQHWTVCRFNRLISSKVDYRGRTPEKVDDGIFLVTARNIRPGKIDYERSQEFTTEEDWEKLSARGKPEIGDVLFTTEAPLGNIAQVDRTDVAFAQRIMKLRANSELVSNDFLAEFMMSASFRRSLNLYASGSTASGIKSERMAHLFGLIPPLSEQAEIVRVVRTESERLDAVLEPIQSSVDRLREFRAALVAAAVSGQIDVAAWGKRGQTDRRLDKIAEELADDAGNREVTEVRG